MKYRYYFHKRKILFFLIFTKTKITHNDISKYS